MYFYDNPNLEKIVEVQTKVCGITQLDDALMCEALGVDFLGFNFVEASPRFIDPVMADEMIAEISPDTICVGIFQNHDADYIKECIELSGIDALQFHGSETVDFIAQFDLPKIKVFSVTEDFDLTQLIEFEEVVDYFLFDSQVGSQEGGTGLAFDWSQIKSIQTSKPWFLAGGLGPDNMKDALAVVQPFGFDLNSKVEKSPGTKDLSLVRECLEILEA